MQRVLITGATGFIGSHLTRRLLADGYEVHALCRPASRFSRLAEVRRQLTIHRVELTARRDLQRLVPRVAPHYVLHLAVATMRAGVAPSAAALARGTTAGTINLIDACAAVDYACFLHTGDAFEYGPSAHPLVETRRCRPTTPDGIAKLAATRYVRAAARAGGRPIVTLRLFSVYGSRDQPRRLVPQVIAAALRGTALRLSQPGIVRDFLYVGDVVELYMAALARGAALSGEVINAGSGQATTIGELVEVVARLTRRRLVPRWGAYPTAAHDH
ncbi:MAG: NAD-dependent epimerase/dehydratase family protein, partial [bacterium]